MSCSVSDCSRPHKARGYCQTHYRRWQRKGTPEDGERCAGTPVQRVLRRSVEDPVTGCREWQGYLDKWGYGVVGNGRQGSTALTHRVVAADRYGEAAIDGMYVCHKCDNPRCVNIDHLFIGTSQDNAVDRERKGRGAKLLGASNPNSMQNRAIRGQVGRCRVKLETSTR